MKSQSDRDKKRQTFNQADIRPPELVEGQSNFFHNDIERLISRQEEFVDVDCPACGGVERVPHLEKYGLSYCLCSSCETVYVSPRQTAEIISWYYQNSENARYWAEVLFPASEEVRRERIFKPRAERLFEICEKYKVGNGLMVEVGAGFGTFCEVVGGLDHFERIVAIEPTPSLAKNCRDRGVEVLETGVEDATLEANSADVVASFEVIEHLFDPRAFVQGCQGILRQGGLLLLTCPNIKGFETITLGEESNTIDVEHINLFHPKSLSDMISKSGFEVLQVLTPGELDANIVRDKVLNKEFDLSDNPFMQHILIDEWDKYGQSFQGFIIDNKLSSHMWVVARKL